MRELCPNGAQFYLNELLSTILNVISILGKRGNMYMNDNKQLYLKKEESPPHTHIPKNVLLHYYTDFPLQEFFLIASPISGFTDLHKIIKPQKILLT